MNPNTRSKVISIRLSAAEYHQLAADAEQQKQAVSGVLLAAWRKQSASDGLHDRLAEIDARLGRIETAMPDLAAIAEWASAINNSLHDLHDSTAKRWNRVEAYLNAITKAAGLEVRSNNA